MVLPVAPADGKVLMARSVEFEAKAGGGEACTREATECRLPPHDGRSGAANLTALSYRRATLAQKDSPQPSERFGGFARWTLILVGLLLAIAGLLLWLFPVDHSKPAPSSAKCTDAKTCWVKVDDAPELLLSSFVVLGALLLLVGVNNRKITKFTGPGGTGFETGATKAAEDAKEETEKKADEAGLNDAEKGAAKLVAEAEAQARAHEFEKVAGRALMPAEIEKVAQDAALVAVDRVRDDPDIH
jgi:hypothetical protein